MPTRVLTNCTVLVNGVDLSGACNEATVNYSAEMLDVTTFGASTRIRKGGLTTFALALKGFELQGTSCEPGSLIYPLVGSTGTIFCWFPGTLAGCSADGMAGRCVVESYTPGGAVGTIMPFSASLSGANVEG